MRSKSLLVVAFLALAVLFIPRAQAQDSDEQGPSEVNYQVFYDSLSQYGTWVEVAGYGDCWQPANVGPDWRPYVDGSWEYTDQGWMWISNEPWGWATYHYGRWINLDQGWFWVPAYDWAPAWVTWQFGDDYCGWAPLPPSGRCGPGWYNFVAVGHFGDRNLRGLILDRGHNADYIGRTQHFARRAGGPPLDRVNARVSRPFQQRQVQRHGLSQPARPRVEGGAVHAYAPQVSHAPAVNRPQPARAPITGPQVNRGTVGGERLPARPSGSPRPTLSVRDEGGRAPAQPHASAPRPSGGNRAGGAPRPSGGAPQRGGQPNGKKH